MRKELSSVLERGHVDLFITYENRRTDAKTAVVDTALALQYQKALAQLSESLSVPNHADIAYYAAQPDVISIENAEEDKEALQRLVIRVLKEAEQQLIQMRKTEGEALLADIRAHLAALEEHVREIAKIAPEVPLLYSARLLNRLEEMRISDMDPQRIAQETAMMADRCAIDEELSRLDSHFGQIRGELLREGPVGKKLDFLVQELNREVNTIGSKANDARITQHVVAAKNEIEKMREQIQNVE